jgi:molecular chaperone DnaJ
MGLRKDASESDIKKEFYKLAKKYHPDARENKECKLSEEKFK